MINTLKHGTLLVTAIFMVATPAWSQAPADAQRNAIRSQCRADYQAHCASIPLIRLPERGVEMLPG
jgi:hypothetical protein